MPDLVAPKLHAKTSAPIGRRSGPEYVELEVTTNFSFLRGASHPDELVYRATEFGYSAIAITDFTTLAGVVRAYEANKETVAKGPAPKLIVGTRLVLNDFPDLLVWATDRASYGRLCRLLTLGKRRAEKGSCLLTLEDVLAHNDGLLAAIANRHEHPFRHPAVELQNGTCRTTLEHLGALRDAMGGRLSLATCRLYGDNDSAQTAAVLEVSRRFDVPLLATNAVYYHDPSRRELQDVLTCTRHGVAIQQAGYRLFPNGERYLKTPEMMRRLFSDLPQAIMRGLEIAEQCTFSLGELRYEYPVELAPDGMSPQRYLRRLAYDGAIQRYTSQYVMKASIPICESNCSDEEIEALGSRVPPRIRELLDHELELIAQLKYEPYFLTVYDTVKYARSQGILCQGRGSAANSAVCFCLGITNVDPSRIDVLFERFISAARGEPPDIDVDFEHERREEVLQYIYGKYGRERAGMTAEVITYRGRSAVRDVGKALGMSLDMVDQMARHLEGWSAGPISDDQLREIGMDPANPHIRRVVDITAQILGFPRHLSQHVGGMVMTRTPLCEMVPIENASMPDRTVIEWDKNDIDTLGILKVDCLGLGMLTCLSKALSSLEKLTTETQRHGGASDMPGVPLCLRDSSEAGGENLVRTSLPRELYQIPPDDPAVYDMICKADTVGVFQIESRAQMSMLPRLKPRTFYDLVIEVAIVRPGPIQGNMVHPYLRRRNGDEPVSYPSEALREVLGKTLGIPLFQEQAMKIAMVGAGFSAGEADQLRRAMAAWRRHGAIERFYQRFIDGMIGNGYTRDFAEYCFMQIRGFGEYGFPESHAASFALLVYASAWIKHYFPAEFACAIINSQPMGFYAPAQLVRDARNHGVTVLPADVNHSDWDCTIERQSGVSQLRLGLRLIKGLLQSAADAISAARQTVGRFSSVEQIHRLAGVTRKHIKKLAEGDAFASLHLPRREALWQSMALSDEHYPLFDKPIPAGQSAGDRETSQTFLPPMPLAQEVMADYSTTGMSLKRHPMSLIRSQLDEMGITPSFHLLALPQERWVKVAGLVLIRQRPATASGVVFETIEDETGTTNIIVKPEVYERYRPAARHATVLQVDGYIERSGDVIHVMAKRLIDLGYMLSEIQSQSRDFH